jgi:hypothetical protein
VLKPAGCADALKRAVQHGTRWLQQDALLRAPAAHDQSFLRKSPFVAEWVARVGA